jgi:hypothetical protein
VNDFNTDVKPLATKATLISNAENTLTQALTSKNPDVQAALTGPAVSQVVQAIDQSSNLRYQLLQYYQQHIDTSFRGSWDMLKSRILSGTLPGNKLQALLTIVQQAGALNRQELQAKRDQHVKLDPRLDAVLPDADSYHQTLPSASAGAASDLFQKYGITPRKP